MKGSGVHFLGHTTAQEIKRAEPKKILPTQERLVLSKSNEPPHEVPATRA